MDERLKRIDELCEACEQELEANKSKPYEAKDFTAYETLCRELRVLLKLPERPHNTPPAKPETKTLVSCLKCNDTGVWETGNNDLPCECPAGSTAKFNVSVPGGTETMTGAEVTEYHNRERHKLPRRTTRRTV